MRFARMTTRRWMIAVAVVAIVSSGCVWVVQMQHRSQHYAGRAWHHRNGKMLSLTHALATDSNTAQLDRRLVEYHERMRLKYEHAAMFPWLSVEPDPPEPK